MKKEISDILRNELKDPRLGFITITSVEVSRDLSDAKVYVSVLGSREDMEHSMEALKSAHGFIRREIGHRIRLRVTPEIRFIYDESIEHGAHIGRLLEQIRQGDDDGSEHN